jgi:1-deoxy-D-xylulose-5-phosphate reductoisomerase
VHHGEEGLLHLVQMPEVDLVVNALVGAVGLSSTLAAVNAGKDVAMANKEPLVMAGGLILEKAASMGSTILPLDSEPNAIWQCLKGESRGELTHILLTASGGPFFGWTRDRMRGITPAQALEHPTWKMGPKITVDSATLMNKGFEVIEASWLFGVRIEQIEVLIHRESIVHSLVEFSDGAMLAHLGRTDMVLPIQYALTHPRRGPALLERLDLASVGSLSFAAPDREQFGCLELCYAAGRAGGLVPAALNAANEIAVAEFLANRIRFTDIETINRRVVELAIDDGEGGHLPTDLETVMKADQRGRERARQALTCLACN